MLNRYWRDFPWFLQLVMFIAMISIFGGFFLKVIIPYTVPLFTGVKNFNPESLSASSNIRYIRTGLAWQGLFHFSIFLLPSLLFAYQTHPRPGKYLGLRKPGKQIQWLLVTTLMLGLMPVMIQIQSWFSLINLGPEAKALQEETQKMSLAFLQMPSFGDFLFTFFVMAILPAFGEEMLFRGILMRFASKRNGPVMFTSADPLVLSDLNKEKSIPRKRMFFPIMLTAVMFAAIHMNFYGFVSILLAGFMLGLIYYWTGSLWCSILAHLINNGFQILLLYAGRNNAVLKDMAERDYLPGFVVICAAALFISSFYLLWKNRTPLTADMLADFSRQELAEKH